MIESITWTEIRKLNSKKPAMIAGFFFAAIERVSGIRLPLKYCIRSGTNSALL